MPFERIVWIKGEFSLRCYPYRSERVRDGPIRAVVTLGNEVCILV